ncbi:MAG: RNA-binding S4 domain-containing protein [Clostridiales bacterium]|jgi:ribosomal 50S subunit-recycling heat shock protein|nr:RNA-binding S4 domain-containing protein [Clostridiales bacterium]
MRLDKFLKVSRILKRRTVAAEACDKGRVSINGRPQKPGAQLKVGDEVEVRFGNTTLKFRVLDLNERAGKADAGLMYEILA